MKRCLLPLLLFAGQLQAQPARVKDINNRSLTGNIFGFIDYNGRLIFNATDEVYGAEVWTANGASAYMLPEINTNGNSVGSFGLGNQCVLNNIIYYPAT